MVIKYFVRDVARASKAHNWKQIPYSHSTKFGKEQGHLYALSTV